MADTNTPSGDVLSTFEWTDVFQPGQYHPDPKAVRGLHSRSDDEAGFVIRDPFRAARRSVTVAWFAAFLRETGTQPHLMSWQNPQGDPGSPAGEIYCTEVLPFCFWLEGRLKVAGRLPHDWRVDLPRAEEWLVASDHLFISAQLGRPLEGSGPHPPAGSRAFFVEWLWSRSFLWKEPPFETDWTKIIGALGQGMRLHTEQRTLIAAFPNSGTWDHHLGFRVICRPYSAAL